MARRVGYDPFFPHAARTVVLTIAGRGSGLVARIELIEGQSASAAREIVTEKAACDELFESAALAIAIAIDPRALVAPATELPEEALDEAPERPPAVTRAARASSGDAAADRPPSEEAVEEGSSQRLRLALDTRTAVGLQPGVAAGLFVGSSLVWRRASLGLEIGSYLPTVESAESGAEVRGWLASGAFVPCLRFEPVSACAVISGGRFVGSGERVLGATSESAVFFAAGGRSTVEAVVAPRIRVHLGGEVLGNFTRATLKVGQDAVWRAAPVAVALAAGASVQFE